MYGKAPDRAAARRKTTAFLLAASLAAGLFAGCARPGGGAGDGAGSTSGSLSAASAEAVSGRELYEEEPWSPEDNWTAQKKLADIPALPIVTAPEDAKKLQFVVTAEEEERRFGSYEGGVSCRYPVLSCESEDLPEGAAALLAEWNASLAEHTEEILDRTEARWKKYRQKNRDSYLFLTDRTDVRPGRTDTRMISFLEEHYCYNRGYEPDRYLFYGHTVDAVTGEKLSLNDLFTDVSVLPALICHSLRERNDGYGAAARYEEPAFAECIRACIEGCREDGCFAWIVQPSGVLFVMNARIGSGKYLIHNYETAFVPFAACREALADGAAAVPYDYLQEIGRLEVDDALGAESPAAESPELTYHDAYLLQKNNEPYLYLSGDGETRCYICGDSGTELTGVVRGEIAGRNTITGRTAPDPEDLTLECIVHLVRELDLIGRAYAGEDGLPVLKDGFTDRYNTEPMVVIREFTADFYEDRTDPEPEQRTLAVGDYLLFEKTDGETWLDVTDHSWDEEGFCRLYVTGDEEDGWIVNGKPLEEILNLHGWLEE